VSAQAATTRPSPAELRGAVLEYAARGVPVLPLRGKLPLIPAAHSPGDPLHLQCHGGCGQHGHGVHDATIDLTSSASGGTAGPAPTWGCAPGSHST
jgi:hypothetical protein